MTRISELAAIIGVRQACTQLGESRSWYNRRLKAMTVTTHSASDAAHVRQPSVRALTAEEEARVLAYLNSERFVDCSPAQVVAELLDEGIYLCSERTNYRILARHGEVRERRNQLRHPAYQAPELLATRCNMVWSWDITKLRSMINGTCYHLYVIIDVFSRYIVAWTIAERESDFLAADFIDEACRRHGIDKNTLILHADRGAAMRSKRVAELLVKLEVTKSHSRPYCSNDNPYSESQFKTMKYRPEFPDRFASLNEARIFCTAFFKWYNHRHCHSGIAMLTPVVVHYGLAERVIARRDQVLARAYERNPERFVKRKPLARRLPKEVWINKPAPSIVTHSETTLN